MNLRLLSCFVLMACAGGAAGQSCPDIEPYKAAREVIADLGRIVSPTGIQRSYAVDIDGVRHWLDIRGQDRGNPVLLSVHGGPAAPLIPGHWQFQRPIEEYFTVVNYDQRGAGKTFSDNPADLVADSLQIQRYVDDAIAIAEHVRESLGQEKMILMAHSWGTIVAMHAAMQRPDLFHAYVGIGQVINVRENERLSFLHGLERAREEGNEQALSELAAIAPYPGDEPLTRERIVTARKWAQHYGGLSAFRSESSYYFRGPLLSPDYDADAVCAINRGNVFTLQRVLPAFLEVDFSSVESFPIPVVMFMGRHDYSTPSQPTADWLQRLDAPYKRAIWFERSAHMPQWEEPGKLLVSLLQHVRPLANPPMGTEQR